MKKVLIENENRKEEREEQHFNSKKIGMKGEMKKNLTEKENKKKRR